MSRHFVSLSEARMNSYFLSLLKSQRKKTKFRSDHRYCRFVWKKRKLEFTQYSDGFISTFETEIFTLGIDHFTIQPNMFLEHKIDREFSFNDQVDIVSLVEEEIFKKKNFLLRLNEYAFSSIVHFLDHLIDHEL
jgi:hypothetical protein